MLDRLDAPAVRRWATTALSRLGAERAALDALNVYPVPDGDTGTNLHLTVQAAVAGLGSRPAEGDDAAGVADAMARGRCGARAAARASSSAACCGGGPTRCAPTPRAGPRRCATR
ncbi:hypothetical protein GCM10025868_40300 [Angustibacter aerolatus]|uniref:DhaL domain-containing protein n=1 Tax=Angustibacter aerolatus TaxID=1162965 RepID=A0ABQ6JPY7_9ACTN|nr:hypothetical protein [Angustibacter aerolatus]GMA88780.1 hypothetical protein GCM10025868_40300 [Angustibacter aerolatus]